MSDNSCMEKKEKAQMRFLFFTGLKLFSKFNQQTKRYFSSGWYFVEKVSDGLKGWIPDHICQEVESSHIRAKHFKQRYLFLKSLTSDS